MDSPIPPDPYQALGLSKTATGDEIRKAYRKLALRLHPDKCNDESLKAARTDEFHLVQQAYDIIGDEDKRMRYDAQIRLAELRRQNLELKNQTSRSTAAPAAYRTQTAAPRDASYATRGSTRATYEEPRRERYYEYDAAPRASAKKTTAYDDYAPPKRDSPPRDRETERARVKLEQEAEARRKREKKRDVDVRESRSTKYDAREVYEEDLRKTENRRPPMTRREEEYGSFSAATSPTQRKMEEREREAQRHMQERAERSSRPATYGRTTSSREVPLQYEVRRSSAVPKERERVRESARRSSPSKDAHRRNAEDMEPAYERPTPTFKSHSSAPPVVEHPQMHRAYTTQSAFDGQRPSTETSPPPLPRSTTMPTATSMPSRRKESTVQPSKLRHSETITPDSGYSSPTMTPTYATKQSYPYPAYVEDKSTSPPRPFKTVIAEPSSSSGARPSNTAAKMAGLDPKRYPASSSSRKTTYAYGADAATVRPSVAQTASARDVPTVERSRRGERDRGREREREVERDQDYWYSSNEKFPRGEKLYGERGAGNLRYVPPTNFTHDNISYAKRYDINDVSFGNSSRPRGARDDFVKPSMVRSTTYAY